MPAFFDQFLGAEVEFPDSMDPTKQQAALGELYRQRQLQQSYQNLGYLGQLIGGMGNQQRTIPRATVTPTAAFAMTPQALQSYMGQQQERLNQEAQMQWASQEKSQERQQQNAIEQARQQQQLKRDIQTEKFRGDQLKLQKMRYDNAQKERDLRIQMQEAAAQAKKDEAAARARKPVINQRTGQQYILDPNTGVYSAAPIPGAIQGTVVSGSSGGGGGRGRSRGSGGEGSSQGAVSSYTNAETGEEWIKGNWNGKEQEYWYVNKKTGERKLESVLAGGGAADDGKESALPSRQEVATMYFKETGMIPTQDEIDEFYSVMKEPEPQQSFQFEVGQSYVKDPNTGAPVSVPKGTPGSVVFGEDGKLHSASVPTVPKPERAMRPPEATTNSGLINSPNPHLQIREESSVPAAPIEDMHTKIAPQTVNVPYLGEMPVEENPKGVMQKISDSYKAYLQYMDEIKRKQGYRK